MEGKFEKDKDKQAKLSVNTCNQDINNKKEKERNYSSSAASSATPSFSSNSISITPSSPEALPSGSIKQEHDESKKIKTKILNQNENHQNEKNQSKNQAMESRGAAKSVDQHLEDLEDLDINQERKYKFDFDDFKIKNVIGFGACGLVLLAKYKQNENSKPVAIKALGKADTIELQSVTKTLLERDILALKNSNFIANLITSFHDDSKLYFVMPFYQGGDLLFHIAKLGRLKISHARFYSCQIASALMFLHENRILHRDLKPDNILLDGEGHCNLVDFGLSRRLGIGERATTFLGHGGKVYFLFFYLFLPFFIFFFTYRLSFNSIRVLIKSFSPSSLAL